MERSWDPDVKKFFVRIINTISMGLIWLLSAITAGLYFRLAYVDGRPAIWTIIYWVLVLVSLLLLIRYFYKLWKKP
jgi:hypothetical protein